MRGKQEWRLCIVGRAQLFDIERFSAIGREKEGFVWKREDDWLEFPFSFPVFLPFVLVCK